MFKELWRKKDMIAHNQTKLGLRATLSLMDLILFGIGAIIGAGVFVLTGIVAATTAGPGVTLSYVLSGLAAMFAALSYAELASSIGGVGSAYSYAYYGFGEFIAWLIGWNLLFEYGLAVSTVAIGWSGYVNDVLISLHLPTKIHLLYGIYLNKPINLLAMSIIGLLTFLLCLGAKESARFNAVIVFIKLFTILFFIVVALPHFELKNWHPYLPFGWSGVVQGASLVFFAYIGFDALSTATEEAINPKRNIPIGIIISMAVCTLIYVLVAGILTGIVHYKILNVSSPVAFAMIHLHYPKAAGIIGIGAIAGLTTVMLVMFYGLTRILLAMCSDGLLPHWLAKVNRRTRTPIPLIVVCGLIMAFFAGLLPIHRAAELVNIGTLTAFIIVCAGVIILRKTKPHIQRPFKLPWNPVIPSLGIIFCSYLMFNLPLITWIRFIMWLFLGAVIYFLYSKRHSLLNTRP